MKKILMALFLLVGIQGLAKAEFLLGNTQDRSFHIHLSTALASVNTSGAMILIDLSSPTIYPHTETGQVNISAYSIKMDKVAASTATFRLGVVTMINVSSGTIKWFASSDSQLNVSNTNAVEKERPYEAIFKLRVNGATFTTPGTTPYLVSNDVSSESQVYQTDVALTTAAGSSTTPGVGDIVLDYIKTGSATITAIIDVHYHTVRR